jgi:AcrR family transcriptional regulator
MNATADRRGRQRENLIEAAEQAIAAHGLSGIKARDLAAEIGSSLGGLYNLVGDMDELILRVANRTLHRLDAALTAAECPASPPVDRLTAIAVAYCRFARNNLSLWRALFEHRMARDSTLPDWHAAVQIGAFAHIVGPLGDLLPDLAPDDRDVLGATLFSAVHGVVALGLDEKLIAVPIDALEAQLVMLVRAAAEGLKLQSSR